MNHVLCDQLKRLFPIINTVADLVRVLKLNRVLQDYHERVNVKPLIINDQDLFGRDVWIRLILVERVDSDSKVYLLKEILRNIFNSFQRQFVPFVVNLL